MPTHGVGLKVATERQKMRYTEGSPGWTETDRQTNRQTATRQTDRRGNAINVRTGSRSPPTLPHTLVFVWTRFQLKLVYGCGHSVQEDQPDETAASIINFAIRCVFLRSL